MITVALIRYLRKTQLPTAQQDYQFSCPILFPGCSGLLVNQICPSLGMPPRAHRIYANCPLSTSCYPDCDVTARRPRVLVELVKRVLNPVTSVMNARSWSSGQDVPDLTSDGRLTRHLLVNGQICMVPSGLATPKTSY